jgi:hypothetical protein
MLEWLAGLNAELIAGGVVGLSMIGVIIRNAVLGWAEARTKLKASEASLGPLATAVAMGWDKNQIEVAIQALDRIAEALETNIRHSEAIAKAQGILSDSFQQTTHMKLNELLERLDDAQVNNTRTTRPHRR